MTDKTASEFDIDRVEIALAEEGDLPAIRALYDQSALEGQLRENDTGADIENLRDAYFTDEEESGFWVARYDGEVLGMIGVQKTGENAAEIRRLRVHEDYRRRGIGTRLIEQAVTFCQHQGYLKVVLDVRIEREPAIKLFEKFGFIHARTRELESRKMLDFYFDLYRDPGNNV